MRLAVVGTVSFAIILKVLSFHSYALLGDSVVGGKMWVFIFNCIIHKICSKIYVHTYIYMVVLCVYTHIYILCFYINICLLQMKGRYLCCVWPQLLFLLGLDFGFQCRLSSS